ncbi:MAG: thiamine diphosphokinase [Chloroflexi bacterium]|nr:thiamine diphosphokinase [Chloroflexota bacterium]
MVAADGGALRSKRLALRLDLIVGDADSIDAASLEQYRDDGVEVRLLPAAKDASDTELALGAAFERGATTVTLLGALGGLRLDHALANVGLLARDGFAGRQIELLDASCRVSLVRGDGVSFGPVRHNLVGPIGGLVSLLPVGVGTTGVTTVGLLYPLRDEPLPAGTTRGLSNVRVDESASISVRTGLLLVVESATNDATARIEATNTTAIAAIPPPNPSLR